jgi:hypothetical protein
MARDYKFEVINLKKIKMKTNKKETVKNKFDLEKMKVAKLENLHLIDGGSIINVDDPATITDKVGQGSTRQCNGIN